MKKTVFIFGDSNSWGWDPSNDLTAQPRRWDDDVRWGGALQRELGEGYRVLVDGLNGRTTVFDDPIEEYRCGKDQIIPSMDSAAPFDIMIIFLGTNDLKARFSVSPQDIASGAAILVRRALGQADDFTGGTPKIVLVCPPPLGPIETGIFKLMFSGAEGKSKQLTPYFKAAAKANGAIFFDAGTAVRTSVIDGLHPDADQHALLGRALASVVREAIG
jgi:lysophospholipase L1-like esterase